MTGDPTDRGKMLELQGDRVLLHWRWEGAQEESGVLPLTFVHVVDVDHRELRLVNRDEKGRDPDWLLTPALFATIVPATTNNLNCKWMIKAKCS